jgi:hypothetical protein
VACDIKEKTRSSRISDEQRLALVAIVIVTSSSISLYSLALMGGYVKTVIFGT